MPSLDLTVERNKEEHVLVFKNFIRNNHIKVLEQTTVILPVMQSDFGFFLVVVTNSGAISSSCSYERKNQDIKPGMLIFDSRCYDLNGSLQESHDEKMKEYHLTQAIMCEVFRNANVNLEECNDQITLDWNKILPIQEVEGTLFYLFNKIC